jgi:hypothetical protein
VASIGNSHVSANSFDKYQGEIKAMQTTLTNRITYSNQTPMNSEQMNTGNGYDF